jgi:hypothetical protein
VALGLVMPHTVAAAGAKAGCEIGWPQPRAPRLVELRPDGCPEIHCFAASREKPDTACRALPGGPVNCQDLGGEQHGE